MYDPIDSFVKDIQGNAGFIDKIFTKTNLLIGTVGIIGVLAVLVLVIK
jgi:hypothetical protein